MSRIGRLVRAGAKYLKDHPDEFMRAAVNAASGRVGVPVAALRFAAGEMPTGRKMPQDVELATVPPAIRFGASLDAMGTKVRASAAIKVDGVELSPDSIKVSIRVNDLNLKLLDEDSASPVALLIRSGVLDLSKPGNVVKHLPKKSPVIVEADGDRITIDLMKVPKIAANKNLQRALSIVTPLLGIRAIETDGEHLYVAFRATPAGLPAALDALKGVLG